MPAKNEKNKMGGFYLYKLHPILESKYEKSYSGLNFSHGNQDKTIFKNELKWKQSSLPNWEQSEASASVNERSPNEAMK